MAGPVLCEVGEFEASSGTRWRVVAAEVGPGAVDTAAAVVAMTAQFQPGVVMFVGIAGALKDDVNTGDVVVGSAVCWTERGKASDAGYLPRAQAVSLSYPLSQLARKVAREGRWTDRLADGRAVVKAVVGQIASGEKVIADTHYRDELRRAFSDAVAIENEGFGLARAAELYTDAEACVIRGISDNADPGKNDHAQAAAADSAAAFCFELLDAYSGSATGHLRSPRPGAGSEAVATELAATGQAATGQVVVGQIPREPATFLERSALGALAEATGRQGVAVVCAVTGLRGVGKTQLAAAFARDQISRGWGLVGWVNAESADAMTADLARIAERAGVADPDGDSAESARRLREHLNSRAGKSLLVFDNAADPDVLRPFLPAAGHTVVVITSVDQAFAELGAVVDVASFTTAESLEYLAARTGLGATDGAAAVADELGNLPLGLAQAAATITRQHLTYQAYLQRLRDVPVGAVLGRVPGGDYPAPVAAALLLNVQVAEAKDPSGLTSRLLQIAAALSPDGIRRRLLDGLFPARPDEVDAAVERCVAGSLLTWSVAEDALIMHRLLGRVLRERDQAAGQWADAVRAALDLLEPLLFSQDQAWSRREEGADLAVQVEALWQAGNTVGVSDPELVLRQLRTRSWAVRQLRAAADLGRAIDLGSRVLADAGQVLGADHPQALAAQDDLAGACRQAGRLGEAITLYEQVVAGRERVLDPDHPDTLTSRDHLAGAYRPAGRVAEAIRLYEQAVAGRERVLGPDHPDTLTSWDNLARAYRSAGRPGEAVGVYERVLASQERVLGPDHPDTLATRGSLAASYHVTGRLGEAIRLFEQNLADRERVLGPEHPNTLISRTSLADVYRAAGRLGAATGLYEQVLADRERLLGPAHPSTLTSRGNLAVAYRQAGRLSEAIALHEQNFADRERLLGPEHPDTLSSRNSLAVSYRQADRLGEAIALHEQNLADRQRVLGPEHPQTLMTRHELAISYRQAGQLSEAIALFEQNLADRQRVLGPEHPHTLMTRHELAVSYQSAGRLDEAIALFEQNLDDRERILSPGHPDTVTSQDSLDRARRQAARR